MPTPVAIVLDLRPVIRAFGEAWRYMGDNQPCVV